MTNSPSLLEEPNDGIQIFNKEQLDMENNDMAKRPKAKKAVKTKNTLSVYTYLNFKQFGLAVRIDDGIKITVLWFETNIKFEKK